MKKREKSKPKQSQSDREKGAEERTLFVRNIGWDTTEQEFREHMEQFGPVDYAVLCKAAIRDVTQQEDKPASKANKKQDQLLGTHKGTGFVRFVNTSDANSLLELSQNLEQ